jgi:hypothetical protein
MSTAAMVDFTEDKPFLAQFKNRMRVISKKGLLSLFDIAEKHSKKKWDEKPGKNISTRRACIR